MMEYEQSKFRKASEKIYKMFVKAESLVCTQRSGYDAYGIWLHFADQLDRS